MLLFYGIKFSKFKCFIGIVLLKKKYNVFTICSSLRICSTWLLRLEKTAVLSCYINCIQIENEFHSLLYSTSKADIS